MKGALFTLLMAVVPGLGQGQEVGLCDWRSSAAALYEPWEEFTRTFSNGRVRIALLDTIEPGATPVHLLILSPPYDALGARQCRVLSDTGRRGFSDADFATLEADYDPSVGLIFEIDVKSHDGERARDRVLRFTLNQATGAIAGSLR